MRMLYRLIPAKRNYNHESTFFEASFKIKETCNCSTEEEFQGLKAIGTQGKIVLEMVSKHH